MLPYSLSALIFLKDDLGTMSKLSKAEERNDAKSTLFLRESLIFIPLDAMIKSISDLPKIEVVGTICEKAVKKMKIKQGIAQ